MEPDTRFSVNVSEKANREKEREIVAKKPT